jgi:hypothetical protein
LRHDDQDSHEKDDHNHRQHPPSFVARKKGKEFARNSEASSRGLDKAHIISGAFERSPNRMHQIDANNLITANFKPGALCDAISREARPAAKRTGGGEIYGGKLND